jgi:enoyl-CoA hydratase/3-hydroxyacyl-CoA dehydrogenase
MNALNEETMCQLHQKFDEAEKDPDIERIIITGEGKAFVAGADIKFFVDNIKSNSLNNIVSFTAFGQQVYDKIDKCKKDVIAIVNGLTLGGGLELALSCDAILAVPKAVFSFPETGIGIYPGLGGTQRTQKRLGKGLAKYMIYTGDFLNAVQAEKMGLVDSILELEDTHDIIEGLKPIILRPKDNIVDEKYVSIRNFFEKHTLDEILKDANLSDETATEILGKVIGKIRKKAPLALKTAEKLINEERGCESELEELTNIFSTSDALLGLSSIGKSVEFKGA